MKRYSPVLFLLNFLVIVVGSTSAQGPKLPYADVGACPFECCIYRQWTTNTDTILYKAMRESAPVAFRLKKGEKVTGLTGVVITTKAGIVKVLKNTLIDEKEKVPVKAGETLYLLTYLGEGYYVTWYKGRFLSDSFYESNGVKQVSEPDLTWWVKVKNRRGQVGWTKLPENFDNKDACG